MRAVADVQQVRAVVEVQQVQAVVDVQRCAGSGGGAAGAGSGGYAVGAGSGGDSVGAGSGVGAEIGIGRNEVWETVFVGDEIIKYVDSAGRIVDTEFCAVLKDQELGTLKEG